MTIAEHRSQRSQLYGMLAAAHAGPLGYSLIERIRSLACSLLDVSDLPEVLPAPKAEFYPWAYGYCVGCPQLDCGPGQPSSCLPSRLNHLAYSASKGARQRRLREASYILEELVPCIDAMTAQMDIDAYRSLLGFTRSIVLADAELISERDDIN